MTSPNQYLHATRDGREIPLGEMTTGHLFATVTCLTKWMKTEEDRNLKAELQEEIRLIWAELRSRKRLR
jgi:uncharacterized protein (DUF2267 family)